MSLSNPLLTGLKVLVGWRASPAGARLRTNWWMLGKSVPLLASQEGWTQLAQTSGGENHVCALLLRRESSTLSMTKCQRGGALWFGSSFHRGVPRSTWQVRLTALHHNAAPSVTSTASLSFPLIYSPAVCYLLVSQVGCSYTASSPPKCELTLIASVSLFFH